MKDHEVALPDVWENPGIRCYLTYREGHKVMLPGIYMGKLAQVTLPGNFYSLRTGNIM